MRTITLFLHGYHRWRAPARAKPGEGKSTSPRIPKPTAPLIFSCRTCRSPDAKGNKNNILDAGEEAEISFLLKNTGKAMPLLPVAGQRPLATEESTFPNQSNALEPSSLANRWR